MEVDDETLTYAEEDWDCPEQTGIDKGVQLDSPFARAKKEITRKKYNPYGEDFVIDRIVLSDMMDSLLGLDEVVMPQEIELVNDTEQDWIDESSEPEVDFEPEMEQMLEQELTNLRVLEWLHDLPADRKETTLTIQVVNKNSIKHISHDNTDNTTTPSESN